MQKTAITTTLFLLFLLLTSAVSAQSLQNFTYMREITITERSGQNLTDYQIMIILNDTNFDFTHAQTNGADIRFTDTNGNLLDYWIEEWDTVNESAKVWVKVPTIPANGTTKIWMYYGNSKAPSKSNGFNTFELFENFDTAPVWYDDARDFPHGTHRHSLDRAVRFGNYVYVATELDDETNYGIFKIDIHTGNVVDYTTLSGTLSGDPDHNLPSICIDDDGYIYVMGGVHGSNGVGFPPFCRSTAPETLEFTAWRDLAFDKDVTYPHLFNIGNTVYCIYRHETTDTSEAKITWTEDRGDTWTTPLTIFRLTGVNNRIYPHMSGVVVDANGVIHWVGTRRDSNAGGINDWGPGIYYMKSDDGGKTWKKADGTVLNLPADPTTADDVTVTGMLSVVASEIKVLPNGSPIVLFVQEYTVDTTQYRRYYVSYWNGSQWNVKLVVKDVLSFWSSKASLEVINNTTWVVYYPYAYADGSKSIKVVKTTDAGDTWTEIDEIQIFSRTCNPTSIKNGTNNYKIIFATGESRKVVGFGFYPAMTYHYSTIWSKMTTTENNAGRLVYYPENSVVRVTPDSSASVAFYNHLISMKDLAIRAKGIAVAEGTETWRGWGVCGRVQGSGDYFYHGHIGYARTAIFIGKYEAGTWTTLQKLDIPTDLNVWYTIEEYLNDNSKWFKVEGVGETPKETVDNAIADSGGIAIRSSDMTVEFDWVLVRKYVEPEPLVSVGKEYTMKGIIIEDIQLSRKCIGSNTLKIEWLSQKYNLSDLTFYIDLNSDGIWDKVLAGCNITNITFDRPDKYKITIKTEYPNGSYTYEKIIQIVSYHPLLNCTNIVNKSGIVTYADKAGVPTHVTITPVNISKEDFIVVVTFENINASKTGDILLNMTIAGLSGGDEIIVEELAPNAKNVDIYHNGHFYKTVPIKDEKVKVKLTTFSEYVFIVNNTTPTPPKEEEEEIEGILIFIGITIGLIAVIAGTIYLVKRAKAKMLTRMERQFMFFRRLK